MKPHEERVIAEKDELREKLTKLDEFIANNFAFGKLDALDRDLLHEQREYMASYLEMLYLRIERFSVKEETQ